MSTTSRSSESRAASAPGTARPGDDIGPLLRIRHLHNQVAASPSDERAAELLAEALASPGVPPHWLAREIGVPTTPLLTTVFRKDDVELRFFSTLTTFSAPLDVALDELRIECNFPADEATAVVCRERFGA